MLAEGVGLSKALDLLFTISCRGTKNVEFLVVRSTKAKIALRSKKIL